MEQTDLIHTPVTMKVIEKTEFRKELDKKRDEYDTRDEKLAFLDGVEWMLERGE